MRTIDAGWDGHAHEDEQEVEAEEDHARCLARGGEEVQEDEVGEQAEGEELRCYTLHESSQMHTRVLCFCALTECCWLRWLERSGQPCARVCALRAEVLCLCWDPRAAARPIG